MLTDDHSLQELKEKLFYLSNAFERLRETHGDYVEQILDENAICEGQRYLEDKDRKVLVLRQQFFDWIAKTWRKLLAESLQVDSAMNS